MTTDPSELRSLAMFLEQHGAHSKANMLRHYADEIELYEPVVDAVINETEQDEFDRQRLEENIRSNDL